MEFKYYDLLSNIIVGYFTMMAYLYALGIDYNEDYAVAYIAAAYVLGYVINAVSSMMEGFWYKTIGGMPSNNLLTLKEGKEYTGTDKIRFYDGEEAIKKLKAELNDPNASIGKMFGRAMSYSNGNKDCRVPVFNANYVFSRVLLTAVTFVTVALIVSSSSDWRVYLIIPIWYICWRRFKERGYYYAREVLIEYLKQNRDS